MNERYIRQIQLPFIGQQGQLRLAQARILVVGAGGLGVPVLQYLAGAGVGFIRLVDDDYVELSNLHRQPIYAPFVGQSKVQAAHQYIQQLNPAVQIEAIQATLSPSRVEDWLADVDAVLDCADSYAVSYVLSDACKHRKLPLISASALATGGYVGGFCGTAPSLRAVFPAPATNTATCASAGVLGPVVGMLGLLQAQMLLALLLQDDDTPLEQRPLGQMLSWELQGWHCSSFRFDHAPEPEGSLFAFIDRSQLKANDWLVDVRTGIEPVQLMAQFEQHSHHSRLVLACSMGVRAWRMAEKIAQHWLGDIALMAERLEG